MKQLLLFSSLSPQCGDALPHNRHPAKCCENVQMHDGTGMDRLFWLRKKWYQKEHVLFFYHFHNHRKFIPTLSKTNKQNGTTKVKWKGRKKTPLKFKLALFANGQRQEGSAAAGRENLPEQHSYMFTELQHYQWDEGPQPGRPAITEYRAGFCYSACETSSFILRSSSYKTSHHFISLQHKGFSRRG